MKCDPTLQHEVLGILAASSLTFSTRCGKETELAKLCEAVVILMSC